MISEIILASLAALLAEIAKVLNENFRDEVRLAGGVKEELEKMESEFQSIEAALVDAARRDVWEESFLLWQKKLEDAHDEARCVLSECRTAAGMHDPACSDFLCLKRIKFRRDIALRIRAINGKLARIAAEKERYRLTDFGGGDCPDRPRSTSFVWLPDVLGRGRESATVIEQVLSSSSSSGDDPVRDLNVVSVVGARGVGTTTLAQVVYNSPQVAGHFDERIWVCASGPLDEVRIAKAILEDIEDSAPNLFQLESIVRKIRSHLEGKRVLLVLDSASTDDDFRKYEQVFNSLRTGAAGSTVLVTTTRESVAAAVGSSYRLCLGELSDVDSWSLFQKIAFSRRSKEDFQRLEEVGRKVAGKCNGSPYTIKRVGLLMRSRSSLEDWDAALYNTDFFL